MTLDLYHVKVQVAIQKRSSNLIFQENVQTIHQAKKKLSEDTHNCTIASQIRLLYALNTPEPPPPIDTYCEH